MGRPSGPLPRTALPQITASCLYPCWWPPGPAAQSDHITPYCVECHLHLGVLSTDFPRRAMDRYSEILVLARVLSSAILALVLLFCLLSPAVFHGPRRGVFGRRPCPAFHDRSCNCLIVFE